MRIFGDGRQHVRATVGMNSVRLLVLDYYGGSPGEIGEYAGLYGNGHLLNPGEQLEGTVRMQLLSTEISGIDRGQREPVDADHPR